MFIPAKVLDELAAAKKLETAVDEIYWLALSRAPTARERDLAVNIYPKITGGLVKIRNNIRVGSLRDATSSFRK